MMPTDPEMRTNIVRSPRVRAQELTRRVLHSVDEVIDVIQEQEKNNFKLGVFLICVAIGTWIAGLELVNFVMKGDEFKKPIFLAVLTGSCFIMNFIPNVFSWITHLSKSPSKSVLNSSPLLSTSDLEIDHRGVSDSQTPNSSFDFPIERQEFFSLTEVLSLASQITVIYLLYNMSVLSSLKYTSASNQTILGSTTTLFTLCLGVMFGIDRLSLRKLACVGSSLIGVVLINFGGEDLTNAHTITSKRGSTLLGNCLALIGAFFYALYLLNMKLKCGSGAKITNERELFGWVGLFTICLGIPVIILAHVFGIEEFSLPKSSTILFMIMVNAVFSVISDYAAILAMLLTSPLVTSLALTSSIPITIFLDFVILDISKNTDSTISGALIYGFGVLCILVSVILINLNIGSENELIEEIIQETFDVAIQDDEILSPILSPYLSNVSSNTALRQGIYDRHVSPSVGFWGKKRMKASLSDALVSKFTLDSDAANISEITALSQTSPENAYFVGEENITRPSKANISLSGGVNHKFSLEYKPHPQRG